MGFNYEELQNEAGDKVGVWDIGGSDSVSTKFQINVNLYEQMQMVMQSIYKNVHFTAIIYTINVDNQEHINIARKELVKLVSEEELRHV